MNVSAQYFRQRIRAKFEENRHVTDIRLIDKLALRGAQEYQETMNFWKQNDHILGTLLKPTGRPPQTFLQKFYEGAHSGFGPYLRSNTSSKGETRTKSCPQLPVSLIMYHRASIRISGFFLVSLS